MPECPSCKTEVLPDWDWCYKCGYDPAGLRPAGPGSTSPPPASFVPIEPPSAARPSVPPSAPFGPDNFPGAPGGGPRLSSGDYAWPESTAGAVGDQCQVCGGSPATKVTFHYVTGLLIAFQFGNRSGVLCRDCGRALGRQTTSRTLMTGWWGFISFFGNWFAVLSNTFTLAKLQRMAPPTGGDVTRRLPPGRPVWKTPGFAVFAAILLVVMSFLAWGATHDSRTGRCVAISGSTSREVPCSSPHDAKVIAVVSNESECPSETDLYSETDDGKILCADTSQ